MQAIRLPSRVTLALVRLTSNWPAAADKATGNHQHPQKSFLLWALTGREPNANFTRIDILRNAIVTQESAGDAAIVNKDSEGIWAWLRSCRKNLAE